jgi:hypothetical protein
MLRDAGWNAEESLISLVDLSILELVDAEPLSNPFSSVLDAESEVVRLPVQGQQLSPTNLGDLNLEPAPSLPFDTPLFVNVSAHVSTTGSTFVPSEVQPISAISDDSENSSGHKRKRAKRQCTSCLKKVYYNHYENNIAINTKLQKVGAARLYLEQNYSSYTHLHDHCPYENEMSQKPQLPK